MKMTNEAKAVQERMKPGVLTSRGFLGSDTRGLSDIIASDEEEFLALGLDFEKVADMLAHLAHEGEKGLGEPTTVDGKFLVRSDDARGKIACPYQDGLFHKNSVNAEYEKAGVQLVYSDLSIHLLRTHHFCQGTGSPFRLDPAVLKHFIGK